MALPNMPKRLQDIHLEKRLGKGFFGEVWKAKEVGGQQRTFAVKKVSLQLIEQNRLTDQLRREIDILYKLEHKRIVRLFFDFKDEGSMFLGMEFAAGGSLFDKLNQARKFTSETASRYFFETCEALDYLHHLPQKVIHRDIKPENILLDAEDHAKLADFGWSNLIEADKRETFCGTLDYLPPEMIMGTGHDESADMWNMGVLTYELTTGQSPFGSQSKEATCRLILNVEDPRQGLQFPAELDADAKDLVVRLCKKKPSERLPVRKAMEHRFVTKFNTTREPGSEDAEEMNRPSVAARKLQKDYEKINAEVEQLLAAKASTEESLRSISTELETAVNKVKEEKDLRQKVEAENKVVAKRIEERDREIEKMRATLRERNPESQAKAAGYPTTEKKHSLLGGLFHK